jgi:hypothetical protein
VHCHKQTVFQPSLVAKRLLAYISELNRGTERRLIRSLKTKVQRRAIKLSSNAYRQAHPTQGRHEFGLPYHREVVARNNAKLQTELDGLNERWKEDKHSLTAEEKFRRNALKRTVSSRQRRINLKEEREVLYQNMAIDQLTGDGH